MTILDQLIQKIISEKGSDIHIGVGYSPILRLNGSLQTQSEIPPLKEQDLNQAAEVLLTLDQRKKLEQEKTIDLSFDFQGLARFRVNGYFERRGLNFALRYIPEKVPNLDELGLPEAIKLIAQKPYGLLLVTGPTGSGKSTSLASIIDYINSTRAEHIITIEDPIEFLHENKMSAVKQREVGEDGNVPTFPTALRSSLREDPDVILIGEMRDLETVSLAITAAETGHLVLSTLHTSNTYQTINRIIDIFPSAQQEQVRAQLSSSLIGIIAQRLLPKKSGGRIGAFEILINNTAIKSLISQNKIQGIKDAIKTSRAEGMILLEDHLKELTAQGMVLQEDVNRYLIE